MERNTEPAAVEWIVTLREDYLEQIGDVTAELESAGLRVERVLKRLGVVCGAADDRCRAALEHVDGVASVEVQRRVRLSPPDSTLQ
ncbi:hypothetical protein GCM10027591_17810 [Zhihengliuella somnathii]